MLIILTSLLALQRIVQHFISYKSPHNGILYTNSTSGKPRKYFNHIIIELQFFSEWGLCCQIHYMKNVDIYAGVSVRSLTTRI